jgi:hypothetical protein
MGETLPERLYEHPHSPFLEPQGNSSVKLAILFRLVTVTMPCSISHTLPIASSVGFLKDFGEVGVPDRHQRRTWRKI